MNTQDPLRPSDLPEMDDGTSEMSEDGIPPEEQIIQKKKRVFISPGTLLMIGLLAAVSGATYLMIRRASAQPNPPAANALAADTTINTFLTGGVQSFREKIALLEDTKLTVSQFNASPAAHQIPVKDLRIDPFADTQVKESAAAPLSDDAARRQEEEARQKAVDSAANLKLQSIIFGTHSGCMINGKLYVQGRGNSDFTVTKITPTTVVVRISGQDFELTMIPQHHDD